MFKKIGIKLIFAVVITTIVIISVFAIISIRSQSQVLIAEVERHSNQLSETVKNSTKYDMLLNRREHILRIIETIGEQEFMQEIRIF
ncbi:MAG: two-component sensor histidine kinase, partial [Calditrichia bacterium]|nr:two-component sensor histidine kinase [Calditrichia bacterium]